MMSFSGVTQADVIGAFDSTSRHLGDFLNIDNPQWRHIDELAMRAEQPTKFCERRRKMMVKVRHP